MPEPHMVTVKVTDTKNADIGIVVGKVHFHLDEPKWMCARLAEKTDPGFGVPCPGEGRAATLGAALDALIDHFRDEHPAEYDESP